MAELSSKLKALKFMQRRQSPEEASSEAQSILEQNRAKLAANVRWTVQAPEVAAPPNRTFKVVYESSGGQNRSSHNVFNDFKKKAESEEEKDPAVEVTANKPSEDSVKAHKNTPKSVPPSREVKVPSGPPKSAELFDIIRKRPAQQSAPKEKEQNSFSTKEQHRNAKPIKEESKNDDYYSGGNRRRN